ncbi:MAG: aminoacyl-histidine dipeptidase [Eubacterium sp.]|nr:aminoacyl-histidine dipeptidase [Eubacterium sp.]
MSVIDKYEPAEVFKYFEEIAAIPHGSGNTRKISDYLVDFANKHGLDVVRDDPGNVVIFAPGTSGTPSEPGTSYDDGSVVTPSESGTSYEDMPPIILQGHMDMVCEKEPGTDIDMENEGLELLCDGKTITARGTTLGADDGIALAYILAILDSEKIAHPPIEAVFTVDEEIGMLGAAALDMSILKGRMLLNIDSEEEGVLLCGCAGGALVTGKWELGYEACDLSSDTACDHVMRLYRLTIDGLKGGHSGNEIDKGRANANILLGRVLEQMEDEIRLISVSGGSKDNAIPASAYADIAVSSDKIGGIAEKMKSAFRSEYRLTDPDVDVRLTEIEIGTVCPQSEADADKTGRAYTEDGMGLPKTVKVMTMDTMKRVINALRLLPNGIQRMSREMEGLVQTSLNMGILEIKNDTLELGFCVRSNVNSEKYELIGRVVRGIEALGGMALVSGDYPGWEYREKSPLRDHMVSVFERMYSHAPEVEMIHAGVECGFFDREIDGLDAISIGPDLKDIHTPNESMDIESVRRTWEYLLEVLKM